MYAQNLTLWVPGHVVALLASHDIIIEIIPCNFTVRWSLRQILAHQVLPLLKAQPNQNTVSLDDVVSSFPVHVEWDLVDYPTVKIYTSFGIHLDNQIFTCLEKLFSNSSSVGKKETRQTSESIMIDIWDAKAEQVTYQHHRHWSNRENLLVAYGIRDRRFHTTPSTNTKAPFTINNVPYGLKLVV
jgi:hypothetical protein